MEPILKVGKNGQDFDVESRKKWPLLILTQNSRERSRPEHSLAPSFATRSNIKGGELLCFIHVARRLWIYAEKERRGR
jgi:hypothetical protein